MEIEEMFGSLKSIDILAQGKDGTIVLVLVCNGFIDGSPETQTALLDKMEGYLGHIQSDEFKDQYPNCPVVLSINFTEKPDELILQLLNKCESWINENGARMEIQIDGKIVKITETLLS